MRPTKDETFLAIAEVISLRGECIRRKVGAVIVSERGRILSTGYNGLGPGQMSCLESPCEGASSASGTNLEGCNASHAEISALVTLEKPFDAHTLYCTTAPCISCVKALLLTSIQVIVFIDDYPTCGEALWKANNRIWTHHRV